jgi:dTMP kinase
MTPGRFIALEGGEGAGKSTQAGLLADALKSRGHEVVLTREPGGTPLAERIRAMLLTEGDAPGLRAEALLFAAARSDHVERLIAPALAAGNWVVCDRFLDSSRAYQGGAGGLADADILSLHRIGSRGMLPDLTLLIEVDPEEAAGRTSRRDAGEADRICGRDAVYHVRVAKAFAAIAQAEPDRFVRIDGNGSPEQTHAAIMAAVARLCGDAE